VKKLPTDSIAAIEDQQQAANDTLRTKLRAGADTGPTRAEISALARKLKTAVAAVALNDQERAEMRHTMRTRARDRLHTQIQQDIDRVLRPLIPSTTFQDHTA
jgi:hypothetical protein